VSRNNIVAVAMFVSRLDPGGEVFLSFPGLPEAVREKSDYGVPGGLGQHLCRKLHTKEQCHGNDRSEYREYYYREDEVFQGVRWLCFSHGILIVPLAPSIIKTWVHP
jgi:hypothetical protein